MNTYLLFSGTKPNGDYECMAILPAELEEEFDGVKARPEDFFLPGSTDIEKIGEIQITGDINQLDGYFSVRN